MTTKHVQPAGTFTEFIMVVTHPTVTLDLIVPANHMYILHNYSLLATASAVVSTRTVRFECLNVAVAIFLSLTEDDTIVASQSKRYSYGVSESTFDAVDGAINGGPIPLQSGARFRLSTSNWAAGDQAIVRGTYWDQIVRFPTAF